VALAGTNAALQTSKLTRPRNGQVAGTDATVEAARPSLSSKLLAIIGLVVVFAAVRAGEAFFIPLAISIFLSYALSPLVTGLERWRLPRPIAAGIVMVIFVTAGASVVYRAGSDAVDLLELLPQAVEKVRESITVWQRSGANPLHHVQEAAAELEKLASAAQANSSRIPPKPATPSAPAIDLRSMLVIGTGSAIVAAGQLISILFLTFFLLAAGYLFRRKLMHLVGPSLTRRKIALKILDDVHRLNQHYFAVLFIVNLGIGAAIGLAMYLIGVDRALVWAMGAAVLHTIPYLGGAAVAAAAALAAYIQLGNLWSALLAMGLVLAIVGVLGLGLQTWLLGRAVRMNAPAVFVSLLFWGMLWGAWGLLLAVPIMVAIKTACDHIEPLQRWGALLGK